ncbi:MAG: DUF4331 domain-containing protein [Pseudonocardiaceae bacterium]
MSAPAARRAGRRRRVAAVLLAAGTAAATAAVTGLLPAASASSHREAPLIAADPAVDNTDVYAFTSPDRPDTVTLIANWQGLQEPHGGPTFYPWADGAHYDINIDSDGDARPDLTYRWIFTTDDRRGTTTFLYNNGPVTSLDDDNLLFRQTYDLQVLDRFGRVRQTLLNDAPAAPSNTGAASVPDYRALQQQAVRGFGGGGKSYAGQADDPFFLDLRVFDLLYGGDLSEVGQDTLAGYNVNVLAIQVPKSALALNGDPVRNPVIGVWSDTDKQSLLLSRGEANPFGRHTQVSRLGNPLINEVIVPAGLKDAFNGSVPRGDADNRALLDRVTNPELPRLVQQIYGIPAPAAPRNDLVEIFLSGITDKSGGEINLGPFTSQLDNADVRAKRFRPSEQLRVNMSVPVSATPHRLGVLGGDRQGFPNGRRLADDVVDISVQALAGAVRTGQIVAPLAAGDQVDVNDQAFLTQFPYVALPSNTAVNAASTAAAVQPRAFTGPATVGPLVTGLAAAALLGAGLLLLRRRPLPW